MTRKDNNYTDNLMGFICAFLLTCFVLMGIKMFYNPQPKVYPVNDTETSITADGTARIK